MGSRYINDNNGCISGQL